MPLAFVIVCSLRFEFITRAIIEMVFCDGFFWTSLTNGVESIHVLDQEISLDYVDLKDKCLT